MKKVVIFLPNLAGGGAERVALNLMEGLYNEFEVVMVLQESCGAYMGQQKCHKEIFLKSRKTIISILHLWWVLINERPDSVISFMNTTNMIASVVRSFMWNKPKLILTIHSDIANEAAAACQTFKGRIRLWFMKKFFHSADRVIAVSQGVKESICSWAGISQEIVVVIYNPIDVKMISQESAIALPFVKGDGVIISIGRLNHPKDFSTLIRAIGVLSTSRNLDVKLLILGDGEDREKLEAECKMHDVGDSTYFMGFVDNPYQYMKSSDVFVLSSKSEGFGNVLVEAMACGLPVVSSNAPFGPKEVLGDGEYGCLFEIGDYIELSNILERILTSKSGRDAWSSTSMQRSLAFEREKQVGEYISVIECLGGA